MHAPPPRGEQVGVPAERSQTALDSAYLWAPSVEQHVLQMD